MEKQELEKAVSFLKNGGTIVFPTDTVYGIGALPEKSAVEKLYQIKKRDHSKKIIALIDDIARLEVMIADNKRELQKIKPLLERFRPGELSVIFQARDEFTSKFDEGLGTIGVRIPKNETALALIRGAGGILLTTSANISGEPAITSLDALHPEIKQKVDMCISDESVLTGTPSTIIRYQDGEIELLRAGNIGFEEICNIFESGA